MSEMTLIETTSFSKIYHVKEGDLEYILKEFSHTYDNEMIQDLINIYSAFMEFSHQNLTKVLGYELKDGILFVKMEYISRGDLRKLYKTMTHREIADIIIQVCRGLEYLHERNIVHGDIKPENVLVDENGIAKIIDYDHCEFLKGNENPKVTVGTPIFRSYEVFACTGYSIPADIWSLGVTISVLFEINNEKCFRGPFYGRDIYHVLRNTKELKYSFPEYFSPQLIELLKSILVLEPLNRPSLIEIANAMSQIKNFHI